MAFFYKYEFTNKRKNIHPCIICNKVFELRKKSEEDICNIQNSHFFINFPFTSINIWDILSGWLKFPFWCLHFCSSWKISFQENRKIGHRSRPPLFVGNLSSRDVFCIDGLCTFSLKTPTLWLNDGDKRKWPRAKSASVNHRLVLKVVKPQVSVTVDGGREVVGRLQIDKTVDTSDIIFFIISAPLPPTLSSAMFCHAFFFRKTS